MTISAIGKNNEIRKIEYWCMVEWVLFFYRITEEDYHDMVTLEPTPKGTERVNYVDT